MTKKELSNRVRNIDRYVNKMITESERWVLEHAQGNAKAGDDGASKTGVITLNMSFLIMNLKTSIYLSLAKAQYRALKPLSEALTRKKVSR